MRVLVTGATGFIGRPLTLRLLREHEVIAWTRDARAARSALGADVEIVSPNQKGVVVPARAARSHSASVGRRYGRPPPPCEPSHEPNRTASSQLTVSTGRRG